MINRTLPLRLLKKPEKVNPRSDFRGLSSGMKWKRSEQEIKDIKDLLQKSNYDMVSDYAGRINNQIERSILEEHPELNEDDLDRKEYERRIKPLIIDKIEEEIESELLDDSDLGKNYDEKIYIRSVGEALQFLKGLTTQELVEKSKTIYEKYYEVIKEHEVVVGLYGDIETFESQGLEDDLRQACYNLLENIIRITYIDQPPSNKDFDFNLIFEKPEPLVFNTALYNDRGELEKDPYGGVLRDYSKSFVVDPYDYEKTQYQKPEDYLAFEKVGTRYGEPLYKSTPSFIPVDGPTEYQRSKRYTRYGGGGKKNRKRTPQRKRTSQRKKTPQRKRTSQRKKTPQRKRRTQRKK